jgi:hypothetical protein
METFGEFVPQTLLGRSKEKVNSRQHIFSPLVTFWAFLAQVLERGSSWRDALQRISAWWQQLHFPDQGSPSSDTSGYCQARARLDEAVLQQIGTQVAEQLERQVTNEQLWQGRRVKIVDGTGLSMPDTAANQLEWPQNSGQIKNPAVVFPSSKWSASSACSFGISARQAPCENSHLRGLRRKEENARTEATEDFRSLFRVVDGLWRGAA